MRERDGKDPRGFTGYVLADESRNELKAVFPPQEPEFIGHHVTEEFGVRQSKAELPESVEARVVGYAKTNGIEALVVEINGTTQRCDGNTYHVTWSLDRTKGYRPVHSNDLLKNGWKDVNPINIHVTPQFMK